MRLVNARLCARDGRELAVLDHAELGGDPEHGHGIDPLREPSTWSARLRDPAAAPDFGEYLLVADEGRRAVRLEAVEDDGTVAGVLLGDQDG